MDAASPVIRVVQRWTPRVGLAILDQGLASGGTFVANLLLARWLTAAEYGIFAIGFWTFLVASSVQNAIVIEPLSVFAPSKRGPEQNEYFREVIAGNTFLSLGLALLCAAASTGMFILGMPWWPMGLAVTAAIPCLLSFWCFRRIAYARFKPGAAALGSGAYFASLMMVLFIVRRTGVVSSPVVLAAFASAGIVGVGCLLLVFRSEGLWLGGGLLAVPRRHAMVAHWTYGRWVLGSAFVFWLGTPAYLPLAGLLGSLSAAGMFKAAQNLFQPLAQGLAGLTVLFLPWFASRLTKTSPGKTGAVAILFLASAGVYAVSLVAFGQHLAGWIYGPSAYDFPPFLLPALAVAAMAESGDRVVGLILRSAQRPDLVFWGQLAAAAWTIFGGLAWIRSRGFEGAVFGMVIASLVGLLAGIGLLVRLRIAETSL